MQKSIDVLELDKRAYNALMRGGIFTCRDVAENWEKLNDLPGAGVHTVKQIKNKFKDWYMEQLTPSELVRFAKGLIRLEDEDYRTLSFAVPFV